MRNTAFRKSARRLVGSSIARFVSILLIAFLGAGAFAGLAAISPNMKRAGDEYYDRQNVMDVRLLSTYGFSDEDVRAVRAVEGISGVMAGDTVDAAGSVGDKDYAFRIVSLPGTAGPSSPDSINRLKMIAGRRPKSGGEAVVIRPSIGLKNIALGSTVSLDKESNGALPDTLKRLSYTVVGIAESPYHLFFLQGSTSVGGGNIDYILYVPQSDFNVDGFTELFATVKGAKERNAFGDDGYFALTGSAVDRLKMLAGKRQTLRRDEFQNDLADAKDEYGDAEKEADEKLSDARAKLAEGAQTLKDAQKEYADGTAEYSRQKADADQKFADAKKQLDDASRKLADAKKQYADGTAEYGRQKADADQKFADAKAQLDEASQKLADAKKQYADGLAEYNRQKADAEKQFAAAKRQLDDASEQISAGERELAEKQNELDAGEAQLADAKQQLDARWADYNQKKTGLDQQEANLEAIKENLPQEQYAAAKEKIEQGKEQLAAAKKQLYTGEAEYSENSAKLLAGKAQLSAGRSKLDSAKRRYQSGRQEYNDQKEEADKKLAGAKAKLESSAAEIENGEKKLTQKRNEYDAQKAEVDQKLADAKTKLENAAQEIADGEKELAEKQNEYNTQKAEAGRKLADARAKLENAAAEIADGEKELAEKQREYDDGKAEADEKLADAKQKIADSEKKLSDLGEPKWFVLDRHMDETFANFEGDTRRMHDLATVFPIVFFLVATLVCLTTMTRMVDEERTVIGTFKALGYSNGAIAGRYLGYAASASLIGSAVGISVGFRLIPTVAWNAYGIVYALPEMTPAFYWDIGLLSAAGAVLSTTLATGIAVKNSLRESPAALMLPKAPKSGKRVFLEYVKPVWNRLTFTQKVTVRNLGLYKKRLLMSLAGIVGCTALVVTAFGSRNAERAIMDDQFHDIFHYDVTVDFSEPGSASGLAARLSNGDYFRKSAEFFHGSAEATLKSDGNDAHSVYVLSPKEAEKFTDYITLYDPGTKENFSLNDDGAVITEKLAMVLNVGPGDTIWVKYFDENERHPVKVTGVTGNYTLNFVYLGKNAYRAAFGKAPEYNRFFAVKAGGASEDGIRSYLSAAPGAEAISFTGDLMGNIRTSIKSVDSIIWILIVSAGLLAFVVLYNLTNINIGERQRELATLKVLGFYDRETYGYIFRETWILSVVGCLAGLVFGIFLYRAVVATVESDLILLNRDLTWQGYLGAAALTLFFTWIVDQCMKPRIRNIDMLESLKSVD